MNKIKCSLCNRNVGVTKGVMDKHRLARSTQKKVKPVCSNSGMNLRPVKVRAAVEVKKEAVMNRAARRAAMMAEKAALSAPSEVSVNTEVAES